MGTVQPGIEQHLSFSGSGVEVYMGLAWRRVSRVGVWCMWRSRETRGGVERESSGDVLLDDLGTDSALQLSSDIPS